MRRTLKFRSYGSAVIAEPALDEFSELSLTYWDATP